MMTRLLLALLLGVATYCVIPNEISAEESERAVSLSSGGKEFSLGTKPNGRPDLTKTARNAGIFLLVASLISFFIKRKNNLFSPTRNTENKLNLVEQLSLGNSSALLLVNALGTNMLLSKHQGKIEFLTTLSPDENSEKGYKTQSDLPAGAHLETLAERVQSIRVASLNAN